jgi:hypothetical protein
MNTRKLFSIVFSIVFACVVLLPLARASEDDQQTEVTFDQPVEIPGRVLPAGSYWFVRDTNDLSIVRVFSLDWKTLYATELTAAAERMEPADRTTFTFAEQRESSKPEALLKWFYPGETIGHEFLYHKQEERELAQDKQETVVVARESAGQAHSGM